MAPQKDPHKNSHNKEMGPKAFLPSSEDRHHRRPQDRHRHSWGQDLKDVVHHLAVARGDFKEVRVVTGNNVAHMVHHQWDHRRWDHHHRKKEEINEQQTTN